MRNFKWPSSTQRWHFLIHNVTLKSFVLSSMNYRLYACFCFFKLFIFKCGFSAKVTFCVSWLWEAMEKFTEITTFKSGKTFLIRLMFQGCRAWRATSNYAKQYWIVLRTNEIKNRMASVPANTTSSSSRTCMVR